MSTVASTRHMFEKSRERLYRRCIRHYRRVLIRRVVIAPLLLLVAVVSLLTWFRLRVTA